jgi:uncharacterized protein
MEIFAKYHQIDPEVFYRQEDIWKFAKFTRGNQEKALKPYYLTCDLIQPGRDELLLVVPMTPLGRDNLRAMVIAQCDKENYGQLYAYSFSRDQQVYGPSQIEALINQDTEISQQFTLWDQKGSEVIRGSMIVEPTTNGILYIQPVYLQESGHLKMPQLKRLIMSQGDEVVMAASLEEAAQRLQEKLAQKTQRLPVPGK